jgi:hypothetical protein
VNNTHRKTLIAVFADPLNGAMDWRRIEALLVAAGCTVTEGRGSSVTFEKDGLRAYFHRPHLSKVALRYRVRDARDFLISIGVTP